MVSFKTGLFTLICMATLSSLPMDGRLLGPSVRDPRPTRSLLVAASPRPAEPASRYDYDKATASELAFLAAAVAVPVVASLMMERLKELVQLS